MWNMEREKIVPFKKKLD